MRWLPPLCRHVYFVYVCTKTVEAKKSRAASWSSLGWARVASRRVATTCSHLGIRATHSPAFRTKLCVQVPWYFFVPLDKQPKKLCTQYENDGGVYTGGGGRGLGLFNQQATREKGQCYTTSCIRVNGHLHPHVFQTTQASLVDRHHPPATLRSLRCRTFLVIPLKHSLAYSLERCSCRAHNQQRPRTLLLLSGRARTRNSSTKHRQLQKTYNKLDAVSFVACRVAR